MPSGDEDPSEDLLGRVELLYTDDAMLHALWAEAIDIQRLPGDAASGGRQLAQLATIAGRLLSSRNGPRIAVLESLGWETPTNQMGRLVRQLTTLDDAIAGLETGSGASWAGAVVRSEEHQFQRTIL